MAKYIMRFERALENMFSSTAGQKFYSGIDDEVYKKEFEEKGIKGIQEKVVNELNKWKHIPLHIAVAGESGCGKSAFINAIRSLDSGDENAADEGCVETTDEICPYKHPETDGFVIWDLPGVGTRKFPKKSYLKQIEYEKYDFFIIMYQKRFRENDSWLATEVSKRKKKYFFVRTHVYQEVTQEMKNKKKHQSTFDEKVVLKTMRDNCIEEAIADGLERPTVFLIDNKEKAMFEFGALQEELLTSYDTLKHESDVQKKTTLAFTLAAITSNIMWCKKEALSERIPKVALDVASSMSEYEEIEKFKAEIAFYQKQFNIKEEHLEENKDLMSLNEEERKAFRICFDMPGNSGGTSVETPTHRRNAAGMIARLKDAIARIFLSKEKWLICVYCHIALSHNLDRMYEQACNLYGMKMVKRMVKDSGKSD